MIYSATECLSKIQDLTKQNLEILKGINDSFFTKQNHLTVQLNDEKYIIPSFLSLENKVNMLEENFINLIHSPKNGEAYFNVNGNTRAIEVKGYTNTPNSLTLDGNITKFDISQNDIFKDFVTPVPHITFNLSSLPNDITSVNVKKIIFKNDELKSFVRNYLTKVEEDQTISIASKNYSYGDIIKKLYNYIDDMDYIEYDTIYKLPIRKNIGNATYVIKSVISDEIDQDLNNIITIKLDDSVDNRSYSTKLTYKLFDDTIEKSLKVGDYLTNFDGTSKLQILEIQQNTKQMKLLVVNGEFTNFTGTDSYVSSHVDDLSKLRFYSPIDFDEDKYVEIPLEEDQYVFIAIAPVNDRMNIQSSWGTGVLLNTYKLYNSDNKRFDDYYKNNVKNIGDILYEISNIMSSNTLSKLSESDFNKYTTFKPTLDKTDILVTRINSHINDSPTILSIRNLYSQKKKYQTELNEVQNKIDDINSELLKVSFDDVTGVRQSYNIQLSELNSKKINLTTSINKVIDEISKTANNSEVPIENSKYRIRGFYNYNITEIADHVIGIKVRYRYKNAEKSQGNTLSIVGENNQSEFIFTDWNDMRSFNKIKYPEYNSNGVLEVKWEDSNDNENAPSINQIDIPISQGETVDVKLKVIYDFGAPFIETTSEWSDIINFEFPTEYLQDIEILDIIKENNNDIETNRFNNILANEGVTEHVNNKIIDQDLVYFHNPNDIASGFYTNERRIISLASKLEEMNSSILALRSDMYNLDNNVLDVKMVVGDTTYPLIPWDTNHVSVVAYNEVDDDQTGVYSKNDQNGVVSVIMNLVISNNSEIPIKLYPLFKGDSNVELNQKQDNNYKYSIDDYIVPGNNGVYMYNLNELADTQNKLQTLNQFITFRTKDINTGISYYESTSANVYSTNNKLGSNSDNYRLSADGGYGASMCPILKDNYSLCVNKNNLYNSYYEIGSKQEIVIPILFDYKLEDNTNGTNSINSIKKTMTFDLRTSLYQDPVNYIFTTTAKYTDTELDKSYNRNRRYNNDAIKYRSTVVL